MHTLLDMASSPEYLAPGVHRTEDIDIDIDPAITGMTNGSCASVPPSTLSYSTPDPNTYSEVSHISPFGTSPVLDERLLTPVSSAASPQLQQRASSCCRQSPFDHHHHHHHHHHQEEQQQQPTPPNTASMYPYPEYMNTASQAPSSMPMQTTVSEASPDLPLLLQQQHHYHHHQASPSHHDEAHHPPPQSNPYFGSYTVSAVPPQEQDQYYLSTTTDDIGPLNLLRQDVHGGSPSDAYTHRPLAAPPVQQQQQQQSPMFSSSTSHNFRLPRLSPTQHSRQFSTPRARRDRSRKNSARQSINIHRARDSFSPPMQGGAYGMHPRVSVGGDPGMMMGQVEDDGPDEEVTLDEKTPADLRRLWDTRRKWIGKKGNGMWEDIMTEYLGEENLNENKKTQVKAALQMKIHRMLLKHGQWPKRDQGALQRAYIRWEEQRYPEILRLYEEEMAGRKKAYEWKSQHVEAQLVKMGLEEPERDRDSKARKRKQVAARHQARAAGPVQMPSHQPRSASHQQHRLPGMYEPAAYGHHQFAAVPQQQHYEHHQHQHRTPSYDDSVFGAEQSLGAQPPALSDEQNDRLAREILEENPFAEDDGDEDHDVDVKMEMLSDYAGSNEQYQQNQSAEVARSRAASLIPGLSNNSSHHHHLQRDGVPDANAQQRSAAVARQACGEMLKQQHYGPAGVGA